MKNRLSYLAIVLIVLFLGCDSSTSSSEEENDNGNNPLTEAGLTYEVNGQTFNIEGAEVQSHNPVRNYLIVVAPSPLGIQLRMIPNKTGTYKHDDGDNEFRRFNVWFPHEGVTYYADNDKGSASITLTEIGTMTDQAGQTYNGSIKGSFSGTFVSDAGNSITVEKGYFYTKNN